jgi:hypothetical protein
LRDMMGNASMRDGMGGSCVNWQHLVVGFISEGCAEAHNKIVTECSGGRVGGGGNGWLVFNVARWQRVSKRGRVYTTHGNMDLQLRDWGEEVRRDQDLVHVNVWDGVQHSREETDVHGGGEGNAQGSQNGSSGADSTHARDGGCNAGRQVVLRPCGVPGAADGGHQIAAVAEG